MKLLKLFIPFQTHLGNRYIMLKPDGCLRYPAVSSFCEKVMSVAESDVPLIVDCERFTSLDYTSVKVSDNVPRSNDSFLSVHINATASFELMMIRRVSRRYRKDWTAKEINSGCCTLIPTSWRISTFSSTTSTFVWSRRKRVSWIFFMVPTIYETLDNYYEN